MKTIAQRIPARYRTLIYDFMVILSAASVVFGWPPEGWATRIVAFFGLLGFGMARANVTAKEG